MPFLTPAQARAMDEEQRLDYLTRTVLGEAVGEGYIGMVAVGNVINNRAGDGRFPADPVAVAGQPAQFSTNSPGAGGNQEMVRLNYGPNTREYQMARAAVQATIIDHTAPDITGNAIQYHSVAMGWPASWPTSIQQNGHLDINGHRFYPQHPVPPGSLDGVIAGLVYDPNEVATQLSVRQAAPRPATLSSKLNLQRNLNRVADQRANAAQNIRKARIVAFDDASPFDIGAGVRAERPSKNPMINPPKATGTVAPNGRVIAFETKAPNTAADTMVSRPVKAPVVASAPWGVHKTVAAAVAATDAQWGRGQLVMEGHPNIPGSVVDWLYPNVEGQGEANQQGKGDRVRPGVTPTTEKRAADVRVLRDANQNAADPPRVVVEKGRAKVIPQSQIERPSVVDQTITRANAASKPDLAITLANQIAAKQEARRAADTRLLREADQAAPMGGIPPARSITNPGKTSSAKTGPAPAAAPAPAIRPATIPGPNPVVKKEERIAPQGHLDFIEPAPAQRVRLPEILPAGAKADPIGRMPDFKELNTLGPDPLRAPDLPRRRPERPADVVPAPVPATQSAEMRDARKPVGPTTRTVTSVPVRVAPVPAGVDERLAARTNPNNRPTTVAANSNDGLSSVRPTIVATGSTTKRATASVSKSSAPSASPSEPKPASSGGSSASGATPSQGSSSSGNTGGGTPHYVSAVTGQTLTPHTVSTYNIETRTFEPKTVYR